MALFSSFAFTRLFGEYMSAYYILCTFIVVLILFILLFSKTLFLFYNLKIFLVLMCFFYAV